MPSLVGKATSLQYDNFCAIFHQAQVNGQRKNIRRSQLVQAHIAGPQCGHGIQA